MNNTDYELLRVNPTEMTVTVLLKINSRSLQEDVVVKNFTDLEAMDKAIREKLQKFREDLAHAATANDIPVHPDLQSLVDKHTKSFIQEDKN